MQLSPKEFEYQFRCLYRPLNMYALRYTENLDASGQFICPFRAFTRLKIIILKYSDIFKQFFKIVLQIYTLQN